MLSVIIPLYNDEKYISKCLESLRSELSNGDEIIVVDNGSTDQSVKIVEKFQYKNIKLVELKTGTVGAVRNFGAQKSRHDLLAFLDSDCVVKPGWRAACLLRFQTSSTIAATGSKCFIPDESSWFVKAWFSQRRPDGNTNYINSGNFIVRRSVFFTMNGFDESLESGEDSEICFRIRNTGKLIVEDSKIAVIHLGNPENLRAFYRQQKWHSIGMFGTVKLSILDKPLLMTFVFGMNIVLGSLYLIFGNTNVASLIAIISFILLVPFLSALYRSWTIRSLSFISQLIVLYIIYYTARLNILLKLIVRQVVKREKRLR